MFRVVTDFKKYISEYLGESNPIDYYRNHEIIKAFPLHKFTLHFSELISPLKEKITKLINKDSKDGDMIIIHDDDEVELMEQTEFFRKYEKNKDKYISKQPRVDVIELNEDIMVLMPGIEQVYYTGDFINVTDENNMFVMPKKEFLKRYSLCDENGIFEDKKLREKFRQDDIENVK